MAKQVINIGTAANDGTGDPLRDAFDKVNDNFTELYNDDAGDVGSITGGTGITASASTGDVTLSVSDNGITHALLEDRYTETGSITTYQGTGVSGVSVDWSSATNFVMGSSLTGAIEFDFTGFKTGQVLTIHNLTGSQTITLDSDAATSETFNKIGANDYDGASTNVLIVECIDDDATAVFNYSILTYVSDPTP